MIVVQLFMQCVVMLRMSDFVLASVADLRHQVTYLHTIQLEGTLLMIDSEYLVTSWLEKARQYCSTRGSKTGSLPYESNAVPIELPGIVSATHFFTTSVHILMKYSLGNKGKCLDSNVVGWVSGGRKKWSNQTKTKRNKKQNTIINSKEIKYKKEYHCTRRVNNIFFAYLYEILLFSHFFSLYSRFCCLLNNKMQFLLILACECNILFLYEKQCII